jgi:hypothetical protein
MPRKLSEERKKLVDAAATAILEGRSLRRDPRLGPVSDNDRKVFVRVAGMSVEKFNAELANELSDVSAAVIAKIKGKLESDEFKASELAFVLSVAEDKRARLTGQNMLTNAQINVQVNNYGERSKDDIIGSLFGNKAIVHNVTPEDVV